MKTEHTMNGDRWRLLAISLWLPLASCSLLVDFPGNEGRPCDGAGQCATGYYCKDGTCAPGGASIAISLLGNGRGSVTSTPAGIDCPAGSCVASYASGTTITLTASPAAGSTFTGWSGGCSGTGTCTIPLTAATLVSASFSLTTYTLNVALTGGASGIVTSVPAGINCPTTCAADYVSGTTVTLTATFGGTSAFTGWSGGACSGTGSCTVTMTAAASVIATFEPGFPVSVSMTGTGNGTVTSDPAGISCPSGSCTLASPTGATMTLTARPNIGSYFAGWTGDCTGPHRVCAVSVSQTRNVTANFMVQTYNTVFVTSSLMAPNLGLAAYDAECNARATAAGLNNATGNAYVAWMTTSGQSVMSRLGAARGFVRVDGRPFADDLSSLLNGNKVLNPIRLDENGADVGAANVWTGMSANGYSEAYLNCNGWSSTSGSGQAGSAVGGPQTWVQAANTSCVFAQRIYCFMKTKDVALTIVPTVGKRIFVSPGYPSFYWCPNDSVSAADSVCNSSLAGARAMLPTVNPPRAASELLDSQALYVRPDGQLVGAKAQIVGGTMESGIWQDGAGTYLASASSYDEVIAATSTPVVTPTDLASTCSDWSVSSGMLTKGDPRFVDSRWWSSGTTSCSCYKRFYCVEQ